MKRLLPLLVAAVLAGPAAAQMKDMDMKMDRKVASGTVHRATGVVTKTDGKGKVTIKHEPVQTMNWPSMTMGFVVKDKALADKLKPGAKVDFEFVQEGKDYVVTKVQ